jgi:hypothetical protein
MLRLAALPLALPALCGAARPAAVCANVTADARALAAARAPWPPTQPQEQVSVVLLNWKRADNAQAIVRALVTGWTRTSRWRTTRWCPWTRTICSA